MNILFIVLIVVVALTSGCATQTKNMKVLVSPEDVKEYNLSVEDGDKVLCEPKGCRVLQ